MRNMLERQLSFHYCYPKAELTGMRWSTLLFYAANRGACKMSATLLDQLYIHFRSPVITRQQFRDFLNISISTDARMLRSGNYPALVFLHGGSQNSRITLESLAIWLNSGGKISSTPTPKRGRPVGSRNKTNITHSVSWSHLWIFN